MSKPKAMSSSQAKATLDVLREYLLAMASEDKVINRSRLRIHDIDKVAYYIDEIELAIITLSEGDAVSKAKNLEAKATNDSINSKKMLAAFKKQQLNLFTTPERLEDVFEHYSDGAERSIGTICSIQGYNFGLKVAGQLYVKQVNKGKPIDLSKV